ncbi:MAG: hypothetical protein ACKOTB_05925, partial [Planctomycetia bacterium]
MNEHQAPGIPSALLLLVVACIAAVQARSVRGAQRHRIQELCRRRGTPQRYDEIVAGSETIAFAAASIVVAAAVGATLLAGRALEEAAGGLSVLELSGVCGWILVVWSMLVVVPMLVTRFAGPRIVVATWPGWRPVILGLSPVVRLLASAAATLGRAA